MTEPSAEQHPLPELFTKQWKTLARRLGLSPRQVEVARLICLGYRNNRISKLLSLAEGTVRMHRRLLYRRLQVKERVGVPVRLMVALRSFRLRKA